MDSDFALIEYVKNDKAMLVASGTVSDMNSILSSVKSVEPGAKVLLVDEQDYEDRKDDIEKLNEYLLSIV